MATAQLKLGVLILLVATFVVGTANGECVYVVEVRTTATAATEVEFITYVKDVNVEPPVYNTIWKRSSNVIGPSASYKYQFIVDSIVDSVDTCIEPCKLTVERSTFTTGSMLPQSIRITGYEAEVEKFSRTFDVSLVELLDGFISSVIDNCPK